MVSQDVDQIVDQIEKVTLKIKIGLDEDRINYVSDNFCRRIRVRNVQNVQNVYDLHSEC